MERIQAFLLGKPCKNFSYRWQKVKEQKHPLNVLKLLWGIMWIIASATYRLIYLKSKTGLGVDRVVLFFAAVAAIVIIVFATDYTIPEEVKNGSYTTSVGLEIRNIVRQYGHPIIVAYWTLVSTLVLAATFTVIGWGGYFLCRHNIANCIEDISEQFDAIADITSQEYASGRKKKVLPQQMKVEATPISLNTKITDLPGFGSGARKAFKLYKITNVGDAVTFHEEAGLTNCTKVSDHQREKLILILQENGLIN